LACCLKVKQDTDSAATFQKPTVEVLLDFKWDTYAGGVFLFFTLCSVLLAVNFTLYCYRSPLLSPWGRPQWTIVVAVSAAPLVLQETLQVAAEHDLWAYTRDAWSVTDLATYSCLLTTLVLVSSVDGASSTVACSVLSATTPLFLWVRLLHFLRGFQTTGVLVRTTTQITSDTTGLLVAVTLVLTLGFGSAFFLLCRLGLLFHGPLDDAFGSLYSSGLTLFSAALGNYGVVVTEQSPLSLLLQLLCVAYVVVQAVTVLNLLTATTGDSYGRVQQVAAGEWRSEQAKLTLEIEQVVAAVLP